MFRFHLGIRCGQCIDFVETEGAEGRMVQVGRDFLVTGIQMAVDGTDPQLLEKILETDVEQIENRHSEGAKILSAGGTFAPAFGMIGTLIGLVQMMAAMDDPKAIGPAMAVALLTTLYGAVIANALALPIADKLALRSKQERITKSLILEGISAIQEGVNPRVVEDLLKTYLPGRQRESMDKQEDAA